MIWFITSQRHAIHDTVARSRSVTKQEKALEQRTEVASLGERSHTEARSDVCGVWRKNEVCSENSRNGSKLSRH